MPKANKSKNRTLSEVRAAAGSKGGRTTLSRHGKKHFRKAAKSRAVFAGGRKPIQR